MRDRLSVEHGALAVAALIMLWARMRSASNYVVDGSVVLAGNDPWYHWRASLWTAHNWPRMLQFDPWTGYPVGHAVGQFGTPFDLLVGTVALVAGLGDPQAGMWAAAAVPAVLGALVAVPVFVASRRAFGGSAAIASVLALALMSGGFLYRSSFGFLDHHVMEALLQTTAVALVVLGVSEREEVRYGIAAGAALGVYLMVWPPAVYFIGVLAVGLAASALIAYYRGGTGWLPPTLTGVSVFGPASVVAVAAADLSAVSLTSVSLPHVAAAVSCELAFWAMLFVLKAADDRGVPRRATAVGVAVAGPLAGLAVSAALGLTDSIIGWGARGFVGSGATGQTISEAQGVSLGSAPGFLFNEYGLLVLLAAVGLYMAARSMRPERIVLVVWFAATLVMALAQVRSNYYLAPAVAVLAGPPAAAAAGRMMSAVEPERPDIARVVFVVIVVSAMALPAGGSLGADTGPGNAVHWGSTMKWMGEETPEPALDYYGRYERTADFDYGDTYGVMSWWDYGHYITTRAKRIPVANPFQQHAPEAADFFLSTSEDGAAEALSTLGPSGEERVRYVVIDDQMATSKFGAMAVWDEKDPSVYFENGIFSDEYRETVTSRLYWGDANGMSHYRLAFESPERSTIAGIKRGDTVVQNPRRIGRRTAEGVQQDPRYSFTFAQTASTVKVFERVEGATITGDAPENVSEAVVVLEVRTNTQRRFKYVNSAEVEDGSWEVTVPYWTDPAGGSVQAVGDYRVIYDGEVVDTVTVTESEVRNGSEVAA